MTTILVFLFWTALAALFYSYAGYPVLIFVASRIFPSSVRNPQARIHAELPHLTVLIVAYNAEQHIRERIKNILASDYPSDRMEILVASDGSTDTTASIVEEFEHPQIRAIAYAQRRGKTATLVDAVRHATGEVVLFTDATNHFDRETVRRLARHFTDSCIGIATGRVFLIDEQGKPVESAYWNMEMMIRRAEMRLGVMLGANGPIYAMRRRLLVEPDRPVINDDLVLPILAHMRHGCGIVYDESARAYMLSSGGLRNEFWRRCRIGAGAYQSLSVLRGLFHWRYAKQATAFVSHKLMRWISPFMLMTVFLSSLCLSTLPNYRFFLGIQTAGYLLAIIGLFAPNRGIASRFARVASSFLVMNLALLAGFLRWVKQPQNVVWSPTMRPVLGEIPALQRELS